mgnify:CR=1 FL=1
MKKLENYLKESKESNIPCKISEQLVIAWSTMLNALATQLEAAEERIRKLEEENKFIQKILEKNTESLKIIAKI